VGRVIWKPGSSEAQGFDLLAEVGLAGESFFVMDGMSPPGETSPPDKVRALAAGDEEGFLDPESHKALDRAEAAIKVTLEEQGHEGGCSAILEGGSTTR
jgi:hypothetical protein